MTGDRIDVSAPGNWVGWRRRRRRRGRQEEEEEEEMRTNRWEETGM